MWIFSAIASAIVAAILFVLATVGVAVALVVFLILFIIFALVMRYRLKRGATTFESNGTRIVFYSSVPGTGNGRRQSEKEAEPEGDLYELSPHEYSVEDVPEKPVQPKPLEERTTDTH